MAIGSSFRTLVRALILLMLALYASKLAAGEDDLIERARRAQSLALERLLEIRAPDGSWDAIVDSSANFGATYIVMLRTTGLIERSGAERREALIVRHMVNQANPDGGFSRYPGSPSCKQVTRTVIPALELVLGEGSPANEWSINLVRNRLIDHRLETEIRAVLERADLYLRTARQRDHWASDLDQVFFTEILTARADPTSRCPFMPFFEPDFTSTVFRSPVLSFFGRQTGALPRNAVPSLSIIYGTNRGQNGNPARNRDVQHLVARILDSQDESGGWRLNTMFTMLNIMALHDAGVSMDALPIRRALGFLHNKLSPADGGGLLVRFYDTDIWSTRDGIRTYLSVPGRSARDPEIRPSIEFLLRWQGEDGSFAWSSASQKFSDSDTTGYVLHALAIAAETAEGELREQIYETAERGVDWLLSRQNRRGGFYVFDPSSIRCTRGPFGTWRATLFDPPSADVTARIASALARLDCGPNTPAGRESIEFLLDHQARKGGWWCRWWAGYIPGCYYVLTALGEMGFQYDEVPPWNERFERRVHKALKRGVAFLLEHQNADGGWGETLRADEHERYAGIGPSTPLYTGAALSGLLRAGYPADSREVRAGIECLLGEMTPDGRWHDGRPVFTVFPRSYYYAHPLLDYIVPLNAINDFLNACDEQ